MARTTGIDNPMRARFRAQVREDVKAAALAQLAEGGPAAVSVNAIAKGLGVSGPALYRYFAGRDDLLAELVQDAYQDLAAALAAATDPQLGLDSRGRVHALANAWRTFARAEPHRYRLLFTPPLPGYNAHAEPLVAASRQVMLVGLAVFADLTARAPALAGRRRPDRPRPEIGPTAVAHDRREMEDAAGTGPEQLQAVLAGWTRLHGFVSLELGGNFDSMGIDSDALFAREVTTLIRDHEDAGRDDARRG